MHTAVAPALPRTLCEGPLSWASGTDHYRGPQSGVRQSEGLSQRGLSQDPSSLSPNVRPGLLLTQYSWAGALSLATQNLGSCSESELHAGPTDSLSTTDSSDSFSQHSLTRLCDATTLQSVGCMDDGACHAAK